MGLDHAAGTRPSVESLPAAETMIMWLSRAVSMDFVTRSTWQVHSGDRQERGNLIYEVQRNTPVGIGRGSRRR